MHESSQKQLFQDHFTAAGVCDIIAMKEAFPKSFDHVGNMPGTYTIHLDPSVPPAQHARRKVPIEYKEKNSKSTSTNGRPEDNHSSNHANRMGLINHIP